MIEGNIPGRQVHSYRLPPADVWHVPLLWQGLFSQSRDVTSVSHNGPKVQNYTKCF